MFATSSNHRVWSRFNFQLRLAHLPDRLARFTREAQILASLNHPNIAAIHGIEEAEGTRALVLELVEGPTLADRIRQGPIPLDEALPIAKQIAEALEAAHEAGVIHRDLKPANIKVREDGTVKVLDFGLAKALDPNPEGDPSDSPTLTAAVTEMGVIMGTAAYMSPEQASGSIVDKRADIWSFGVVLLEMLTGQRMFTGETVSHVLASVLKTDPDWTGLPTETPVAIHTLLRRCLARDRRARVPDIGMARFEIDDAITTPATEATNAVAVPRLQVWQRPIPWGIAGLALLVVGGLAVWGLPESGTQPSVKRFWQRLPEGVGFGRGPGTGEQLALSPDGRTLVYRAAGNPGLYRRPIDQFEATLIPGTRGARDPFFSPDGQWIGFWAPPGELLKVALAGGPPQTVSELPRFRGADWGADDMIVLGLNQGLMQVPADGGEPTPLFTPDDERRAWWPQVLPGGDAVLFTLTDPTPDGGDLHLLALENGEPGEHRLVVPNAAKGRILDTGHLVFVRSGALWAVPFDQERLDTVGDPTPVVEGVRVEGDGAVQHALGDDGTLVYIPAVDMIRPLLWVDRDGREELIPMELGNHSEIRLSPSGDRFVVVKIGFTADERNLWVYDIARQTLSQITVETGDRAPIWTPDGQR